MVAARTNPGLVASATEDGDNQIPWAVYIEYAIVALLFFALVRYSKWRSGGRSNRRLGSRWDSGCTTGCRSSADGSDSGGGASGCGTAD
jgi:uncharacterized membrane protein YgcG